MTKYNIAIDLGNENTTIYKAGGAVVLKEPTLIAFDTHNRKKILNSVGIKAKKLIGKTNMSIDIYSPIDRSEIVDSSMMQILMNEFLGKIKGESLFQPQYNALFTVPCGLNDEEKLEYKRLGYACGFSDVTLVPASVCALLGMGVSHADTQSHMVVNLGGGVTDIAVVNSSHIVSGITVNLGGIDIDNTICDYMQRQHGLSISAKQAERIKIELGSLLKNDTRSMFVDGVDCNNNLQEILIYSREIRDIFVAYFEKVAQSINTVLADCSSEVISDISRAGIYLCGGISQIIGVDRFLATKLNLPVYVHDEGEFSTIFGAGVLINNSELVDKIRL